MVVKCATIAPFMTVLAAVAVIAAVSGWQALAGFIIGVITTLLSPDGYKIAFGEPLHHHAASRPLQIVPTQSLPF
jgi:hypothetical protein